MIIDAVNNFRSAGQGMKLFKEIRGAVEKEKKSNHNFDDSGFEDIDTFFVLEQVVEIQEMFKEIETELTGRDTIRFLPKRSRDVIQQKACVLGIKHNRRIFEEWEDELIRKYYPVEGYAVYKRLNGKTKNQCAARAKNLGVLAISRIWTDEEIEILKKYYPTEGTKVRSRLNNRTKHAVTNQVTKSGLKYERKNKNKYVIKRGNKYAVQIYINGKNRIFGTFDSELEAAKVAMEKAKE